MGVGGKWHAGHSDSHLSLELPLSVGTWVQISPRRCVYVDLMKQRPECEGFVQYAAHELDQMCAARGRDMVLCMCADVAGMDGRVFFVTSGACTWRNAGSTSVLGLLRRFPVDGRADIHLFLTTSFFLFCTAFRCSLHLERTLVADVRAVGSLGESALRAKLSSFLSKCLVAKRGRVRSKQTDVVRVASGSFPRPPKTLNQGKPLNKEVMMILIKGGQAVATHFTEEIEKP